MQNHCVYMCVLEYECVCVCVCVCLLNVVFALKPHHTVCHCLMHVHVCMYACVLAHLCVCAYIGFVVAMWNDAVQDCPADHHLYVNTAATQPQAPQNVTLVSVGTHSAMVRWDAESSSTSDPVVMYYVQLQRGNQQAIWYTVVSFVCVCV